MAIDLNNYLNYTGCIPLPTDELVRIDQLVYVQNIWSGEIETSRRADIGPYTTPTEEFGVSASGERVPYKRMITPSIRVMAESEAAELVPVQRMVGALKKLSGGARRSAFNQASKWIAEKWNQSPEEYLAGFDSRLKLVTDDGARKQRLDARGMLQDGFVCLEAEKKTKELLGVLQRAASEWRVKNAAEQEAAILKAKQDDLRMQAAVQGEYLKALAAAAGTAVGGGSQERGKR
jgi:hypothetical protein